MDVSPALWAYGERFDRSAAVGVEEGNGSLDAPVDAWVRGQVEAAEDGGDVGFDGSFRDGDAVGDGLVGVAFGEQGQHAAFLSESRASGPAWRAAVSMRPPPRSRAIEPAATRWRASMRVRASVTWSFSR